MWPPTPFKFTVRIFKFTIELELHGIVPNMEKEAKRVYDRAYHANRTQEQKDRKVALQYARLAANKRAVLEYLLKNPCVDCGEADPVVLEFDHQGGKTANVSDGIRHGWSLKRIMEEIAKCNVRCANCHRRATAKAFGSYRLA
jgi:hypothetical protein